MGSRKGQKRSDEFKKKVSDSTKRLLSNPEEKAKRLQRLEDARNNPEVQQRLAEARLHTWDDARKAKHSAMMKAKWQTLEYREKALKAFNADEVKQKQSERLLKQWEPLSLEERNEILGPRRAQAFLGNPTSIEIVVSDCLKLLGVEHEMQYIIDQCCVDIYVPSRNMVIECNGCYWHGCKKCGFEEEWQLQKRIDDRKRYYALRRMGYIVKVIWEHRVYHQLNERLMEFFQE